ncbi:thioredoxin, putative [Brugia malayi]|uniref:Bm9804 n=3 Tax=Brugia TaxID=6278 RepID=A0A0K0K0J2_BRUMA|nr:thioredoxin, putative [Brugia malayi]CDP95509.1 Bm9804 [Brugia malayi]VDN86797.1 unnamed protein product [Brugia pahangi]VDO43788.1 unnamed protein product [Brugia timori]VIO94581.1 thioredoxin, putative [Brugia malayi]
MADLLANINLKKADGTVKKGSDALANKKVVALYFSAHWCPQCRQFTPILKVISKLPIFKIATKLIALQGS